MTKRIAFDVLATMTLAIFLGCERNPPTEASAVRGAGSAPTVALNVVPISAAPVTFDFEVPADDPDVTEYGPTFRCPSRLIGRSIPVGIPVAEGVAQFTFPPPFTKVNPNAPLKNGTPTADYRIAPTLSDNYAQYEASGSVRVACYGYYSPAIGGKAAWFGTVLALGVEYITRVNLGFPPQNPPPPQTPAGCAYQVFYDPDTCSDPGNVGNGTGGVGGPPQQCPLEWVVVEISYNGGATWSVLWAGWATTC